MKLLKKREPVKKALLVGLNKYHPSLHADLRGCVNDVENMRDMLINLFGFDPENIRVVIDDRATFDGITERLSWLLLNSKKDDELVFHYSGHGSQVRDRNGDELDDHLDEILCPYNLDWNNPFTDDLLAMAFRRVHKHANLTMICDSCHSGTMTRGLGNPGRLGTADRSRFLTPPFDIVSRSMDRELPVSTMGKKQEGSQRHVLLSGCRDDQTSADAHIDNKYQGAFTWALTTTIRANPNISWKEAHRHAVNRLQRYTQIPQISGDEDLVSRKVFGGK